MTGSIWKRHSRDRSRFVVQATDLTTFLSQVLDPDGTEPRNALHFVHQEAAQRIWKNDPDLIPLRDALTHEDPLVSGFAQLLPDTFGVLDLRPRKVGSGFRWGQTDPDTGIRRNGTELMFGVQQQAPGLFRHLFRRK